ncbi:hypothetical protein [Haladaptatus sp. R4]|uniref:hypothetical protein n=1 Tax=Haladaptatus sp. R4 TaxID=1679489 RepID=UPI0016805B06|nr:hypothetical protein [Haladaptatus sp. R4]
MSSSRVFWVALAVYGISVSIRWVAESLPGPLTVVSLVTGVAALGIIVGGIYGTLRPDEAGGPAAKSPLTYCAVLGAVLSTAGLVLQVL